MPLVPMNIKRMDSPIATMSPELNEIEVCSEYASARVEPEKKPNHSILWPGAKAPTSMFMTETSASQVPIQKEKIDRKPLGLVTSSFHELSDIGPAHQRPLFNRYRNEDNHQRGL